MTTWPSAFAYWVVEVYAMATVVLAAALIVLRKVRQPARRLAAGRWTLYVLLCLPLVALLSKATDPVGAAPSVELAGPSAICDCGDSGATLSDGMTTVAKGFAACCGLAVTWMALGALATARLAARTTAAPESLRRLLDQLVADGLRPPRLRVGGVSQPMTFGLFRPTIVLPVGFAESEPEVRVEAAIAHEWAHVRGGDLWTLAASRLLFVILFAHPLYYVLRAWIRADQEVIADAEAAGPDGKVAYAEALVGWARRASSHSIGPSLTLLGRPSMLRERVMLLLDAEFRVERACPRAWLLTVRAFATTLVAGLGVLATTGTARTALSAVVPAAASHIHPSEVGPFGNPPDPASPEWPGFRGEAIFCCPTGVK